MNSTASTGGGKPTGSHVQQQNSNDMNSTSAPTSGGKKHGAKKADRKLDPKTFDVKSLMGITIPAGTYTVDFFAGWMNEEEDWGAYNWSHEALAFWGEPARRRLIEEYPETWDEHWDSAVHGEMPDDDLAPDDSSWEWGECDTEYLDVHVTFQDGLGGKIEFPEGWGSTGVSLDKLCEAAGEGSDAPPPEQYRIHSSTESAEPPSRPPGPWGGPRYMIEKGWKGSTAYGTEVSVEEPCSFREFIYKLVDEQPQYDSWNCKCQERTLVNGLDA